jgi:cytochrome c5
MFSTRWKASFVLMLLLLVSIVLAACGGSSGRADEGSPAGAALSQPAEAAADQDEGTETIGEEHAGTESETHDRAESDEAAHMEANGHAADGYAGEGDAGASDELDEAAGEHEDMAAMHGIPAEAAAVANPIEADEASVARGAELFQVNCSVCHGPTGAGDGPGAAGLDPKPANLSDGHVQENTDGSIFYVINLSSG